MNGHSDNLLFAFKSNPHPWPFLKDKVDFSRETLLQIYFIRPLKFTQEFCPIRRLLTSPPIY